MVINMEINIVFILVMLIMLIGAVSGYSKGILKELIHLITSILAIAVLAVLWLGIREVLDRNYIGIIMTILLLVGINIVNKVATFIYDTLKIVSALPGVKLLDKLAGMLFGIIEVTLVIWLIFIIMSLFDLYGLNTWLEQQVYDNIILTYLYNNNYLVEIIRLILTLKPL
ncbi:MAG: CvpA family protein [Lachnospiraceae bacterium]|nr:CvpA family protein [Lachnospiraceae bacterium]